MKRADRTRKIAIGFLLLLASAVPVMGAVQDVTGREKDIASFERVWELVATKHYDANLAGLDWGSVRLGFLPLVEKARNRAELRRILRQMLARLGQTHFDIIAQEDLTAAGAGTSNADANAGMDLRLVCGRLVVTRLHAGGAAESAGIQPGWVLIGVDDEQTSPWLEREMRRLAADPARDGKLALTAMGRLSGRHGDQLTLVFLNGSLEPVRITLDLEPRPGAPANFGHVRGVKVETEWRWLEGHVGYFAFNQFLHPDYVMGRFNEAMQAFLDGSAGAIIVDLRGNTGGIFSIAQGIAGWLLPHAVSLGEMRMRDARINLTVHPRARTFSGKVAVLVDAVSLSSAEAFAAGLQDLGRARLFGQRTAGAVLASAIERLPNGDAFQYVFADYLTPAGRRLEGVGVMPDELVPLRRTSLLSGRDEALERALDWARIGGHGS